MNTATSAVDGSNDSHSSMSPALTHESGQDVIITENGSTDLPNNSKTRNSKSQAFSSCKWPTNQKDEVIFVDLRTDPSESERTEVERTYPKSGANGTLKHLLNDPENSDKTHTVTRLEVEAMTFGKESKQDSLDSVPVAAQDSNFKEMGIEELHSQPILAVTGNCDVILECSDLAVDTSSTNSHDVVPKLADLMEKHTTLETSANKIINKIHNLQSMVATRHVRQQLMILVEHHHKVLNLMSKQTSSTSTATIYPSSLIDLNSLNNLSTSALVDLVQRMQTHFTVAKNNNDHQKSKAATVTMSRSEKSDVQLAAGVMLRNLRELHADLDSDATASSSGGETDDEDVALPGSSTLERSPQETDTNKLQTKACWRWCRDRSLVISRWTWLQAQVSDLEYKIRQHGTLHANLRKAKSQILSPTGPSISTTTDDSTYRAARCMPLSAPVTKPRHKTMRISDAPSMGSKGRKPVMVRCQCIQAIRRCAICAGHHNYFKPMDIHSLPVNERISQVDKGFHPVLSFPREIDPQLELEAVVNSIQNKHASVSAKKLLKKNKKLQELNDKKPLEREKMKARKKLKKTKLKQKKAESLDNRENLKLQDGEAPIKKRKYTKRNKAAMKSRSNSFPPWSGDEDSMPDDVALSSSVPAAELNKSSHKKPTTSFGIDDIVIPYHIAAATRVEKLQYKEIDTPRWRELLVNGPSVHDLLRQSGSVPSTPITPGSCLTPDTPVDHQQVSASTSSISAVPELAPTTDDGESQPRSVTSAQSSCHSLNELEVIEDLSDAVFLERHDNAEAQEKKNYINFVTTGSARRQRARSTATLPPNTMARTPCAESSMLPDPSTTAPDDSIGPAHRPLTQTTSIPLSASHDSHQLKDELHGATRKRSNSMAASRMRRDMSMDIPEPVNVQPWPTRTFPLTGDDESALDPTWISPHALAEQTTESGGSQWKVVTTAVEEEPHAERGALVLKLSKA